MPGAKKISSGTKRRRGPPPKPTALRVIEGNPSRRPLPENEPRPSTEVVPEPPDCLDARALARWHWLVQRLQPLGLLTEIDGDSLAGYCVAYSAWCDAVNMIREHGRLTRSAAGTPKVSPLVAIANQASAEMRAYASEFGLSPAARTRIQVTAEELKNGAAGDSDNIFRQIAARRARSGRGAG